jgi:HlyD family secretion protein
MRRPAHLSWIVAASLLGCSAAPPTSYQGYVEGEYVHVASALGGRLERLLVQRGQSVDAGAPLFVLEADEELAVKQQADEQLKASEAQLADLKLGKRNPELDVAQAQLAQAQAAEQQAARQLERDEAQLLVGAIPRTQVEDARANHAIKAARTRELKDLLAVSKLPARGGVIDAQGAQVEAARAALTQSSWRLAQKHVSARGAGLVADTLYREGEWVAPGSPVIRMRAPEGVKLRFFVPQAVAGGLKPGRELAVQCDGCGAEVTAAVTSIADEPEYTPPVIYSNENRAKLVFMVEARPAPGSGQGLRPGQPVSVTLR